MLVFFGFLKIIFFILFIVLFGFLAELPMILLHQINIVTLNILLINVLFRIVALLFIILWRILSSFLFLTRCLTNFFHLLVLANFLAYFCWDGLLRATVSSVGSSHWSSAIRKGILRLILLLHFARIIYLIWIANFRCDVSVILDIVGNVLFSNWLIL